MTTKPKPPTPQGISALLRKAGFERSQRIGGRYGAPVVSEGYHVKASSFAPPAAVDVRYRTADSVSASHLAARFPGAGHHRASHRWGVPGVPARDAGALR